MHWDRSQKPIPCAFTSHKSLECNPSVPQHGRAIVTVSHQRKIHIKKYASLLESNGFSQVTHLVSNFVHGTSFDANYMVESEKLGIGQRIHSAPKSSRFIYWNLEPLRAFLKCVFVMVSLPLCTFLSHRVCLFIFKASVFLVFVVSFCEEVHPRTHSINHLTKKKKDEIIDVNIFNSS